MEDNFQNQFGLYEWMVMPFGLTNTHTTFMRLINEIFRAHMGKIVLLMYFIYSIFSLPLTLIWTPPSILLAGFLNREDTLLHIVQRHFLIPNTIIARMTKSSTVRSKH
jgi:hypothetical protein